MSNDQMTDSPQNDYQRGYWDGRKDEAAALARRVESSGRAYVFKKTAPEPHQISGVLAEDDDVIEALDGKRVRLMPEGWRMLRPGEVIERDDQFLQGDSITWEKAPLLVIGMEYRPGVLHPARRLAAAPVAPEREG